MFQSLEFSPSPLLSSPIAQTILGSIPALVPAPPSVTHIVPLPDGDKIACEISTPQGWHSETTTVILIHGMCGSSQSPSLIHLARKLYRRGLQVVRMNLRSCGTGRGLARNPYHGGRSEDALAVVKALKLLHPDSPLVACGFSIGGNIALKLAGELGSTVKNLLERVIAICPPVDLGVSIQLMGLRRNRLYENAFIKGLRQEVADLHSFHKDLEPCVFPKNLKMFAFDQLYTAPTCGFSDALDYYKKASSKPLIPEICCPCHIIFAEDDPLIDPYALDETSIPTNIKVWRTPFGGHMGFIGFPGKGRSFRWLDSMILNWICSS